MAKETLVILAEGFEDIEAVTPIDILRRAKIDVTVAALKDVKVTGARGVTIIADKRLDDAGADFDALILPGGSRGAENLAASAGVRSLIMAMHKKGKVIAAICAAPAVVLAPTGILNGKQATCYPGMESAFDKTTRFKADDVVVDGAIITSRGPATALAFSLAIVEKLAGREEAEKVRKATLAR